MKLTDEIRKLNNIPLKLQYEILHTIEALQQENERLKEQIDTLSATVNMLAPTEIGKECKHIEVLKRAREALENHECGIGYTSLVNGQVITESCECCDDIREALAAIDKAIGGKEDV